MVVFGRMPGRTSPGCGQSGTQTALNRTLRARSWQARLRQVLRPPASSTRGSASLVCRYPPWERGPCFAHLFFRLSDFPSSPDFPQNRSCLCLASTRLFCSHVLVCSHLIGSVFQTSVKLGPTFGWPCSDALEALRVGIQNISPQRLVQGAVSLALIYCR